MRRLFMLVACGSVFLACVQANEGSRIEMTLVGLPPLQRGLTTADVDNPKQHYEIWATLGAADATSPDSAVRLLDGGFTAQSVLGRLHREPLPTPDANPADYLTVDPCMMDRVTGERVYYTPTELAALKAALQWTDDDPDYLTRARLQARTVALALNALIAVTTYATRSDVTPSTDIGTDRASWEANNRLRLERCTAFFAGDACPDGACAACPDEACRLDRSRYYVGTTKEMTHPINGTFYGMLGEGAETQDPASHGLLGGIELLPPYNLTRLVGLFVTVEDDQLDPATGALVVDPNHRGAVLTSGTARTDFRGLYRVELRNAKRTIYGTASVHYSLDSDPVQF